MTDPLDIEFPNPNPDEVQDDGLGLTQPEPFDPADVDEDTEPDSEDDMDADEPADTRTPEDI